MQIVTQGLPGGTVFRLDSHEDERGSLTVSWVESELWKLLGAPVAFRQQNLIHSIHGVVRGLHYNLTGRQGKLVQSLAGVHWSVAVDMRRDRPTLGMWFGAELDSRDHRAFWIPPGFAHGVICLSDEGLLHYASTTEYDPANERSLSIFSDVNVRWPLPVEEIKAKPADLAIATLEEFWRTK